ncbi:type VI secretion system lipoprotein TssJ [Malaciobacter marinus]|jgi:type VI secretion system protein VasD|uniref:Type VI secretion system protein VasD n=1 Tax=Malaciobacter marinus TaxID=505249 RepID=A0AB36ZWM3_9BACT|nr:type VI secretion system lipoprotein TssJ [Malaciobacter marinus]PPK61320.1 type VI secretion system protein VasD [Malaciobacter marinus]SKB66431.1 type VI secretion system protein VasD [Malaciobacter marinus]
MKLKLIILTLAILILSGCSTKPTHLELVVNSSKDLNQDLDDISSPLMLTFYELKSAEKFIKYDYWSLLEKSGRKLGDDLISQTKQVITPMQEQTYKISFDEKTNFLGVIGNFRKLNKNKQWKYVINLEKDEYNYIELKVENFKLERVD